MSTERSAYDLDADPQQIATAILEKEHQTLTFEDEKLFRWLNYAVYGSLLAFVLLILEHLLAERNLLVGEVEATIFSVLILGTLICFLATLVLLGINKRFFLKLWYQASNVRHLGLSAALEAPWKAERRKNRVRNLLTFCIPFVWLGIIILGVLQGWLLDENDPAQLWIGSVAIMVLFLSLIHI